MKITLFTGFLFLGILSFYRCTDVHDYWEVQDNSPHFKFLPSQADTVIDSLKVSQTNTYKYSIIDEETKLVPKIQKSTNYQVTVDSINQIISLKALSPTHSLIVIKVIDSFGKTAISIIDIVIFSNLAPVAILKYNITKDADNNSFVKFIASDSYDMDKKFGGTITNYEYSLDGNLVTTSTLSTLTKDISQGNHTISLRVKDNDGTWSNSTNVDIIVN
jgi:hypothetical protein